MNKIFNWTFGSIFRTIGRIIAYLIIGFILFSFINFDKIKDDIKKGVSLDSWVGISKTYAAVLTENVKNSGTSYLATEQTGWTNTNGFFETTVNSSDGEIVKTITFDTDIGGSLHDYIQLNILASNPQSTSVNHSSTISGSDICIRWTWGSIDSYNQVIRWDCDRYSTNQDSTISDREYVQNLLSGYNFMATINYQGGWAACTFQDNALFCPTNRSKVNSIDFHIMYKTNYSSSFNLGIHRSFVFYDYDRTGETIIQNQNQNTQSVINNQNANTNATMENQNQNTQQQIDSQKVCNQIDLSNTIQNGFLVESGNITDSIYYKITDYIKIYQSEVKLLQQMSYSSGYTCFYNVNKQLINCRNNANLGTINQNIDLPVNSYFMRSSIQVEENKPKFQICTNGNQAMANTIIDSNINESEGKASSFFSNFSTTDNGGLSSIITAPLNAIQSLTSATCSPLVLPLPFVNENLILPCMRSIYEDSFGGFMTLYDVITIGIISYWIIVRIFNLVKDFKNPEHDEIEVVDL